MGRRESITDARNLRLMQREQAILKRAKNVSRKIQQAMQRLTADQSGRRAI
jgi:hypothetical protein